MRLGAAILGARHLLGELCQRRHHHLARAGHLHHARVGGARRWRAPRAAGIKEGRLAFLSDARRGPVRWVPIGNCVLPAQGAGSQGQAGAAAAIADSMGAPMRFWKRFTSLLSLSILISLATSLRSMPKVRLNHEKRLTHADQPEN